MLKLYNVRLTVNPNTPLQRTVLHDLDLNVRAGEFATIIGGNGCGKSTLFNVIAGAATIDAGKILINNRDVNTMSVNQRASAIAFVLQDPRLGTMENMTIEENLSLAYMRGKARGFGGSSNVQRRDLFKHKLSLLKMGLENRMSTLVGSLSGGQRQALSLIMAIVAEYQILLLDEITAALDPRTADNVMEIAAHLVREEKRTAIMITHNMQHALAYATRIFVMKDGRIKHEYDMQAKNDISIMDLTLQISNLN